MVKEQLKIEEASMTISLTACSKKALSEESSAAKWKTRMLRKMIWKEESEISIKKKKTTISTERSKRADPVTSRK